WELATEKKVRSLNAKFQCFAFAPDSRSMVACSGAELHVLEVPSAEQRGLQKLHTGLPHSVAISPDGQTLASGSDDTTVLLWNISAKEERACLEGHTGPVLVRFAPDGKLLATASATDPFVILWDAAGKERARLPGTSAGILDIRFSPDGQSLAVIQAQAVR